MPMKLRLYITTCMLACALAASAQISPQGGTRGDGGASSPLRGDRGGLRLFSAEMYEVATHQQSVVMHFLERYFQSLQRQDQGMIQTRLSDDKVFFRQGSIRDLSAVSDTMPFTMSLVDRHYEVSWMRNSSPFVSIVFPAQYDLLFGMNQEQAQRSLKDSILAAPHSPLVRQGGMERQQLLPPSGEAGWGLDSIYSTVPEIFELESLNNATYYYKEGTDYIPVFDEQHLSYSAANLFHALIPDRDYRMHVEQSVYGMQTVSYMLYLSQWLNYCAYWNMEVFFAVEEEREDGMLCLIIARNSEFSFNHLLSVVVPDKFITDPNAVLKARITPYIPTHNVRNIYQQSTTNRKKKRW